MDVFWAGLLVQLVMPSAVTAADLAMMFCRGACQKPLLNAR